MEGRQRPELTSTNRPFGLAGPFWPPALGLSVLRWVLTRGFPPQAGGLGKEYRQRSPRQSRRSRIGSKVSTASLERFHTAIGLHPRPPGPSSSKSGGSSGVRSSSRFLATIAEGPHPIPSRTRKLSPPAPMVLQGGLCGRVGRRQIYGPGHPKGRPGPFFWLRHDGPRKASLTQRADRRRAILAIT